VVWVRLLMLVAVLAPGRVRADDWLAVLPACEDEARGLPAFELIYPRAGLPALVEAGQKLIVRVRLPSPLTPPPGVQQARALAGWSAELIGHALGAGDADELVQRYPLEVVNVRPDGPASLIYRASLPIPAWAAPGSYDLAFSAPGGHGRAPSLVRVLAQGRAPRVAWVAQDTLPDGDAIAALPIDVWVRADLPPIAEPSIGEAAPASIARTDLARAGARAPLLDPRGQSAALRLGAGLWVFGGCHSPHLPFEDEVASVLASEQRARMSVGAPASPSAPGFVPWGAAFTQWPPADALRIEHGAEQWRISVASGLSSPEVAFVLAAGDRAVQASAGTLSFYPAGEITAAQAPALVVWLALSGPGASLLQRGPVATDLAPRLIAFPPELRSGDLVHVRVAGAAHSPRTAYRFDPQHTAFGPSAVEHVYTALGVRRVDALAIAADGRVRRLHAEVHVGTAQRSGCRCQLAATQLQPPRWISLAWLALALDLMRLRVRRRRARACRKRAAAGHPGID
jgi:hypothetical protein